MYGGLLLTKRKVTEDTRKASPLLIRVVRTM